MSSETSVPSVDSADSEQATLTLLVTSPRVAAGMLTRDGWRALESASVVLAREVEPGWAAALDQAGIRLELIAEATPGQIAEQLVQRAGAGSVVWFVSPDGDPGLTDALAQALTHAAQTAQRDEDVPAIEVLVGAHDVPGGRLLDLVAVMDELRSPGGCPWDAEQTHESLLQYLLEETHEVIDAVQSGDRGSLLEELGDLLLQVVFHARIAAEHEVEPFGIDEVAAGIVAKMVTRHPHVFGADDGVEAPDAPGGSDEAWDELKAKEKPSRGVLGGIPATLPALAKAQKVYSRLGRSEKLAELEPWREDEVLAAALALIETAKRHDADAESAVRAAADALIVRFIQ